MPEQLWEALKIVLTFIFGAFGLKVFEKFTGKKRENLEQANLYHEGSKIQVEVRANIDKIVEEKTKALNTQINELKDTIIHISTRYKSDMSKAVDRMADIENKFDEQMQRNKEMEDRLTSQIKIRMECLEELTELQRRINEIERKTS